MKKQHDVRFPGESDEYRRARNKLLEDEVALENKLLELAAARRALPLGGRLKENYVFDELAADGTIKQVRFSELFAPKKDTLLVYSFMYGPEMETPCPMCTSVIDGLEGAVRHATRRINMVVVAKSPIQRIQAFANQRGWKRVRLLSSRGNTYNADYFAEDKKGEQTSALNVFARRGEAIHHFYNTEMLYLDKEGHVDRIWALWNILDLAPEGRGDEFFPNLSD